MAMRTGVIICACLFLFACASTPYRDVPVSKLTDQQLVDELDAAAKGVGQQLNKADYLLATTPDALYVLSSSTTNYTGVANVSVSGYYVPKSRGYSFTGSGTGTYSGVAQTRYYYTDVNAYARLGHALGAALATANAQANRQRGAEVLAELQRRASARREQVQNDMDAWFKAKSPDEHRKALFAAVLAWIPLSADDSTTRQLEKAQEVISTLRVGPGGVGDWFGVFSQVSTLPTGQKYMLNQFVRISLDQAGEKLIGTGDLGTGERIEFEAQVSGAMLAGTINNRGAGMLLSATGKLEDRRLVVDYRGGSEKIGAEGRAVLYR